MALILGIESSCDDIAAAVYDTEQQQIIAHHLFSQISLHELYGGVVPEIASRAHLAQVEPVVAMTLHKAGITSADLSAVAVTNQPGLAGSLLVGFSFAKALAWARNIPLLPVNHLAGHIFSSHLLDDGSFRPLAYPHLAISASGGHSSVYRVSAFGEYTEIGNTLDDAAGEAFDKIAKLLGLGYPGGAQIEKLAAEVNFQDFFKYPRTKQKSSGYFFSFSGLKTAILYDLAKRGYIELGANTRTPLLTETVRQQVASSMLVCVGDIFVHMVHRILRDMPDLQGCAFVGGVACNQYLRTRLTNLCNAENRFFAASPRCFSTDNGAMIALVGAHAFARGVSAPLSCDIFQSVE